MAFCSLESFQSPLTNIFIKPSQMIKVLITVTSKFSVKGK